MSERTKETEMSIRRAKEIAKGNNPTVDHYCMIAPTISDNLDDKSEDTVCSNQS